MSRNPKIEAILDAWWDLDHSEPGEKAKNEARLNALLDERIGKNPFTKEQVLDWLYGHYLEYRKERRSREKLSVVRSVPSK